MQVDVRAQALQQLQVHRGHGGEAEDVRACRERPRAGEADAAGGELLEQREDGVAAVAGGFCGKAAPEGGLPLLVERDAFVGVRKGDGLFAEPRFQPLGPVREVLVEQAGHARGEFVAHHGVGLGQPRGQARLFHAPAVVLERGEDAPGEHLGLELCRFGQRGHQRRSVLPEPARQVREVDVGADAVHAGQLDDEAARDGGARDDHLVGFERRAARRLLSDSLD